MRISNISKFLGGADNVNAIEVIRGEQINFEGVLKDGSDNVLDISDFDISAVAEYYTADVTVKGSSLTITEFTASTKDDMTLTVSKNADPTTGKFTVTIPQDLADDSDTADLDAQNQVFIAAIYLTYSDGGSPATIRKSRLLVIVRHAA